MGYLRVIVFVGGFAFIASCATATAPPLEGYETSCPSVSSQCQDMGTSEEACEEIAPAGFYWEAQPVEKAGEVYRCPYELRRIRRQVSRSDDADTESPGCRTDQECKGDRICVDEHCQDPGEKAPEP